MSCKHCNFFNTEKCALYKVWELCEDGEITEDEANEQSEEIIMHCEDKYHDWQLDQWDIKNDR